MLITLNNRKNVVLQFIMLKVIMLKVEAAASLKSGDFAQQYAVSGVRKVYTGLPGGFFLFPKNNFTMTFALKSITERNTMEYAMVFSVSIASLKYNNANIKLMIGFI